MPFIRTILCTLLLFVIFEQGLAEQKKFIGNYSSAFGENETLYNAKKFAREGARRNATDQAGLFIKSEVKVVNGTIESDIIETISAAIITVLYENVYYTINNNQIFINVDAAVLIDTDDVGKKLNAVMQNKGVRDEIIQLKIQNNMLNEKLDRLSQELSRAKDEVEISKISLERSDAFTQSRVNELTTKAWIALAGSTGSVLQGGSSSPAGRREARLSLEEAVGLDPNNGDLNRTFGILLMEEKQFAAAVEKLGKAIQTQPNLAQNHYTLGQALLLQNKNSEAMLAFNKAVELDPNMWRALNMIGVICYENGDIDNAINYYQKTTKMNPGCTEALYNLGICYYSKKEYEMALTVFRDYLQIATKNPNEDKHIIARADSLAIVIKQKL